MQDLTKNNFDFIRVLLAFIVFVGHLGALSASPDLKIFENSPIEIAVFGFFVVSGFLIARSYERSSSLKSYIKKGYGELFLPICWLFSSALFY